MVPIDVRQENASNELSRRVLEVVTGMGRKSAGQVAKILGVDKSFVSLVKSGKRSFRMEHLLKLEQATGLALPLLIAQSRPIGDVREDMRGAYAGLQKLIAVSTRKGAKDAPSEAEPERSAEQEPALV